MQEIMCEDNIIIGRDQVRRLMRMNDVYGEIPRKSPKTTIPGSEKVASDKVQRQFTASKPHELWVADIT